MNWLHIREIHVPTALVLVASVPLVLAAGCSVQPSAKDQEVAARQFNVGVGYLAEAKFAEAQVVFDSARSLVKTEPCYALAAGQARMNQARYDSARILFDRAVALDSTLREGWYAVAFLALREGRNEDALAALQRCPDDPSAQYLTGVAHNRLDEPDQAELHLRESIRLNPHFISAHYALAQLYQRTGKDSLAMPVLARFAYLKDHGGTSIDLGGDVGTKSQGTLAETPIPYWRKRPIAEEHSTPLRIRMTSATWPSGYQGEGTWVTARISDLNADGRDDLVLAAQDGVHLWQNEGGFTFRDITPHAGLPERFTTGGGITNVALGDFTNTGRPDLVIMQWSASSLWRRVDTSDVRFVRDPLELPPARTGTWADMDHDGMLDLILVPFAAHHGPGPGLGVSYWRNSGGGTLTDCSDSAGVSEAALARHLEGRSGILDVQPADWDQDWDTDLLLCFSERGPMWLNNQHDGRFVSADGTPALTSVALPEHLGPETTEALATNAVIGDLIPNGWLDIATGGATGLSTVATTAERRLLPSDTFPAQKGPAGADWRVRSFDLDLDGDLDLVAFKPGTPEVRIYVNQNNGIQWDDRSADLANALPLTAIGPLADVRIGSLGEKGRTHLVLVPRSGLPLLAEVQPVSQAARIRLIGGRSAREGVGAIVDIAQGHHWQRRILASDGAGQSGGDLIVGLPRLVRGDPIDMIRVTWTSGIRQSVVRPSPDSVITIVEKPGETSSCPFVYTWDGTGFRFVADAIGGGVLGVVVDPPETYHHPDPDEYLLVRGQELVTRDGLLEVRVAEVLNEATLLDQVRLLAVAHPAETEVYPAEQMPMVGEPPRFAIYRVANAQQIARASDGEGQDVTELLREKDRRFVRPGPNLPYVGFGRLHTLTLDLGELPPGRPVALIWDGWTSFWNSTSIAYAAHDGVRMIPPRLEIPDGTGGWRTIIADIGVPAGKPKTIFTDLTGKLPSGVRTVRLVTNLLVEWDRVRVTTEPLDSAPVNVVELPMRSAELRYLGYPSPTTPDGTEPYTYDHGNLRHGRLWPTLVGWYTRYGPVAPLLNAVDDQFVIMNHGDEIALAFAGPPAAPEGWVWDYLVYLNGYMKETVPRDPLLSKLDPLPFHGMPGYPYDVSAGPRDEDKHAAYLQEYNTRRLGSQ